MISSHSAGSCQGRILLSKTFQRRQAYSTTIFTKADERNVGVSTGNLLAIAWMKPDLHVRAKDDWPSLPETATNSFDSSGSQEQTTMVHLDDHILV